MPTNNDPHFRNLVDNALIGILDNTLEGKILFVNQALASMLEFESPQQMQAEGTLLSWRDPEDRKVFISRLKQQGYVNNYEIAVLSKTGKHMHVLLSARLQDDVISSMVVDITGRKKTEIALQESNERFRATFEQTAVGLTHMTPDRRYLRVNQKFCDITGYSQDELLQRTSQEITCPDDIKADIACTERLLTGETSNYSIEKRFIRKDGELVWAEVTFSLVRDAAGAPLWIVSVVQNISQRKQTQEKLQEYQQRLRALASELTLTEERERRNIALDLHDHVGQSLAAMRMQLAVAQKESGGRKVAAILDEVSGSLRTAIQDTRNVISDLSSPILNELGLAAALSEWIKERIGERYGLETQFIDDGEPRPLGKDTEAILYRSVRELLTNVVKHANANRVSVSLQRRGGAVQIVVEDDGAGFADSRTPDKDSTESGFGLFSIKERMSDLNGSLEIESHPWQGVRAILTAPLEPGD